jgi:teichuronic acid biosynthesis glycosyltransferase TuaC
VNGLLKFIPSESKASSGPKILWVTNAWPDELRPHWGTYVRTQARSLWKLGLEVDVLVVRGFVTKKAYATALPEVRRYMRDPMYHLVHAHFGHTAAMAVTAARHPLVISFCGEDLLGAPRANGRTLKSTIESAVFKHLPRMADATITKSREMELHMPRKLRARNTVLPNGVDTEVFAPRSQLEARQALGWDHDQKIALFLGDPNDPRKRVELAQQAMELVEAKIPNTRLEIAYGIDPKNIPNLMNAVDCLVFPSRSEGSPNAVKEAMAAALPIVATPVGDIPERFDGVDGCVLCEPDRSEFSSAIIEAFELQRAPAARDAVKSISVDAIAARLHKIYLSVL